MLATICSAALLGIDAVPVQVEVNTGESGVPNLILVGITCPTAADSDTITMSGSTTGGVRGSMVELQDVASGIWMVRGSLVSTGAEATPFSAAVS